MSRKEKLIVRFLSIPSDFHFDELKRLLQYHGYKEVRKGGTSGSRVRFLNAENTPINLHRPHPDGIMKRYQLKQIKLALGL